MELDPRYVDVAVRRWQDFVGSQAVHAKTSLTFDQMAVIRQAPVPLLPPPATRENTEEAHRRLKRRGAGVEAGLDKLLSLDDERRKWLSECAAIFGIY